MKSKIYYGKTFHQRHFPIKHAFVNSIYFFGIDLDEIENQKKKIPLFSYNRFNLISLYSKDYLGEEEGENFSIKEKVAKWLKKYGVVEPLERVFLITMPRFLMFAFNSVNFYYCYGENNSLIAFILEVNNTFGGKHLYVQSTKEAISQGKSQRYRFSFPKTFHVSPFNQIEGYYQTSFSEADENVVIHINLHKEKKPFITTGINCKAIEISLKNLLKIMPFLFFSIWSAILKIGYYAAKIYFKYNLEPFDDPIPENEWTVQRKRPLLLQELLTGELFVRFFAKLSHSEKKS